MEKYVPKIHNLYVQVCQVVKYQHPQLFIEIFKKNPPRQLEVKLLTNLMFLELDKINYTNLKESQLNNKKKTLYVQL